MENPLCIKQIQACVLIKYYEHVQGKQPQALKKQIFSPNGLQTVKLKYPKEAIMENPLCIKQIQACVASVVQEHHAMAGKSNHGRRLMIQSVCFKEKGRPSTPAPTISMTEH